MSSQNLLIDSLSQPCQKLLLQQCIAVPLPRKTTLYHPQQTISYAYFLTSGIASIVTPMEDGAVTEVEMTGREGLVGSLHLLGPASVSTHCFMQLEGTGLRMEFARLQEIFHANEEIRDRILEFVQEQALTVGQIAGCHRLHSAEQRLVLWLLTASDRTQSQTLEFTQEFLAEMMGTRRTTVTAVATALQRRGLIQYQRGKIALLQRAELEKTACYCYRITSQLYRNLYQNGRKRGD